jgi:group I intron endonuclease
MKKGYIYKITSPTGKVYIGKTTNIVNRKSSYKCLHCKGQKILYHSLLKYGLSGHSFEIIHEGRGYTTDELSKLESYYIIKFNSYNKWNENGMNLTLGGDGCRIEHHSEETKKKISESKRKLGISEAQKEAAKKRIGSKVTKSKEWINNNAESIKKPILQYSLDGEFIKEWRSAKDVENELGLSRKNISNCLRGKTLSAFNFIWRYKNINISERKRYKNSGVRKRVINVKTGEIYKTISDASKASNINHNTLANYLSGKIKNKTDLKYAD